jgi:hypothetical protein
VIRLLTITGQKVRLTYETTDADESGLPFFDVTVLDEAGNEVGAGHLRRGHPGGDRAGGARRIYHRGEGGRPEVQPHRRRRHGQKQSKPSKPAVWWFWGGDGQPVPTDPTPEDQYRSDVDPPRKTSSTIRYPTNPFPTRAVCRCSVSRPSGSSASSPRSRSSGRQRAGTPDLGILAGSRRDDVAATSSLR